MVIPVPVLTSVSGIPRRIKGERAEHMHRFNSALKQQHSKTQMSKRPRSPSPITVRTRANVVRRDMTSPKDSEFIDLALVLFRLFNYFGEDLLRVLMKHIVRAELEDHVTLHTIETAGAPSCKLNYTPANVASRFDNAFVVERGHWWSRLFANVLILRAGHVQLDAFEENFWREFHLVVGTLKPKSPFILSRSLPGRHFVGDWMKFRSPLVTLNVYHINGFKGTHSFHPTSMPGHEFYALFPKQLSEVDKILDKVGEEIKVVSPGCGGDAGGPGLPFSTITSRTLESGEDYKLEKRMIVWKNRVRIQPWTNNSKLEWIVDREVARGLVHDFNDGMEMDEGEENDFL